MLTPVEIPRFGGLDLSNDPQEGGALAAVDAMDVMFDSPGRLRTRSGARFIRSNYTPVGATTLAMKYSYMAPAGQEVVALSSNGTNLYYSGDTSALIRTVVLPNASTAGFFAELGTPSTTYLAYTTDGAVGTYANSAATLTAAYGGGPLAVSADSRLVICSGSRVRFSVPGDPTTYNANDYVDVTPGDGETITAAVTYGNETIVFKQTKFFVFYGNSVDGSGNPVFNYRMVNTGHGAYSYNAACLSPEGVYFADGSGVWITTGGAPQKVSGRLDRLFAITGGFPATDVPYVSSQLQTFFTSGTNYSLTIADDHLLVTMITPSGPNGIIALHRPSGLWTAWSLDVAAICGIPGVASRSVSGPGQMAFVKRGTRELYRVSDDQTVDQNNAGASAPVTARYRTGYWNPGSPGGDSVVREWLIDGTGTIALKSSVNDVVTLGASQTVTLGSYPAIAQGRDRRAVRGRNVSFEISGTTPWSVSRVIANVRSTRNPGLKAT